MVYRTAKAIREVQPKAKCYVTAITWHRDMPKNDYYIILERLKNGARSVCIVSRY